MIGSPNWLSTRLSHSTIEFKVVPGERQSQRQRETERKGGVQDVVFTLGRTKEGRMNGERGNSLCTKERRSLNCMIRNN